MDAYQPEAGSSAHYPTEDSMYEHLLGQRGLLEMEVSAPTPAGARKTFQVPVRILDVRRVYGRTEFLVGPLGGSGAPQWVSRERVRVEGA